MMEIVFTSQKDGRSFRGFLPPYATMPLAEHVLVRQALHTEADGELLASVRPAFAEGSEEVVALGVFADLDEGYVSGLIDPFCELISAAVNDVWREVVEHHGRDLDDRADYSLRAGADGRREVVRDTGVRVMGDRPSPWRHRLTVPPVREMPLEEAVAVGSPRGWPWRIFRSSVLQSAVAFFKQDLENERMGVLHGHLALSEQPDGLLPYVLYEAFSPLAGTATACSVEVAASAQASTVSLPVAALMHSHPPIESDEQQDCPCEDSEVPRGTTLMSPTDLYELRTGLPHVHQASFVAALSADPGEKVVLTPYGYSRFGSVSAETGFWVIDDDCVADALHMVDEGENSSAVQVKERVQ